MDELELLKKDWKKKRDDLPRLSYDEIYRMSHRKSASIVKWIFYISIIELVFWVAISVGLTDREDLEDLKALHLYEVEIALEVCNYLVIIYFIYRFYRNYRKISTTDSSENLMKSILTTRKTVMRYVWFNLSLAIIYLVLYMVATFLYDPNASALTQDLANNSGKPIVWIMVIAFFVIFSLLFIGVIWVFYRLVYGILLSRLHENYKELKRLEV